MPRQPKATAEDKRHFEDVLIKTVNELFQKSFDHDTSNLIIAYYESLHIADKRLLWNEMASHLQKPRPQVYKFYNNTFKANVMPQWPGDLLEQMVALASQIASEMARDLHISEEEAIRQGVEKVKNAMHIRGYEDFHQETAHHKIRNAFVPVFREQRRNQERNKPKNSPPIPIPAAAQENALSSLASQLVNTSFTRIATPQADDGIEADTPHGIQHCRTQENILNQPLQQATTNDFMQCPYVCGAPLVAPALPAPLQACATDDQFVRDSDLFFSAQPCTRATYGSLGGGTQRVSHSIYDAQVGFTEPVELFGAIEYETSDENIGLG